MAGNELHFDITADAKGFNKAVDDSVKGVDRVVKEVSKQSTQIDALFSKVKESATKNLSKADATGLVKDIRGALNDIGKACEQQEAEISKLVSKYDALKSEASQAFNVGNDALYRNKNNDASQLNKEISARKEALKAMREQSTELEAQIAPLEQVANKTENYRTRLRELKNALIEMEASGKRGTAEYRALQEETAKLTDAMADAQAQANILANDQRGLQGIISGINGLAGAMSTAQGVMALFGAENEDLQKTMVKLQGVMAIVVGLQQVEQALNKDSAFRLVFVAKAKEILTTANYKLATAMGVSTATAKVLMATLTLGLSVAITAIVLAIDKLSSAHKESAKEAQKNADAQKKVADDLKNAVGESIGDVVAKYRQLSAEWRTLSSNQEKAKWIEKNKSAFNSMGLAVKNIADAEKVLISQSSAVINALTARAKANAWASVYEEKLQEKIKNDIKGNKGNNRFSAKYNAGDVITADDIEKYGLTRSDFNKVGAFGDYHATTSGAEKLSKAKKKEALEMLNAENEAINKLQKGMQDASKEAIKAENAIGKLSTGLGGSGSESDKANKKELNKVKEHEEELRKAKVKAILERRQAEIDAMEESTDKRIKQAKLDYDKEIIAINEAEREANKKKLSSAEQKSANEAKRKLALAEYEKQIAQEMQLQKQSLYAYLAEYGTMQQKRLAIANDYNEQIAKAQNEYEKEALRMQMQEALQNVDSEDIFSQINWENVFSDLTSHTQDYLKMLKTQLQDVLNSGKVKSIEDLEKIQSKITEINDLQRKNGGLFGFVGSKAQEQARLKEQAQNARSNANDAQAKEIQAFADYLRALEKAKMNPSDVKAQEQVAIAEAKLGKAREATAKATAQATSAEDAQRRKASQAVADWFSDAQEFIVKKGIDQLPELFNSIGLGGVGDKISKGLSGFNDASGAAADFASGNYIGALTKGISAIQNFGRALGIGGGNEAEVNKITEENTKKMQYLSERIDKLKDAVDKNTGIKAVDASQSAQQAQAETNRLAMKTLQAQMGYHSAHHSNAYYANNDKIAQLYAKEVKNAERAGEKMVSSISGLNDLYTMTPEQISAIKTYMPSLWEYITSVGKYDKSEYWEAVVDQAGKLEEITNQLNENLTQTSFDSLRDSFVSSLGDMDKSASGFADDFSTMMFNAMLNAQIGEALDSQLKDFYNNFSAGMKDGTLSDTELANLRTEYQNIVDEGLRIRNMVQEVTGYGEASKQSATAKGIQAITEDTAEQLVGRITAMQIAVEQIKGNGSTTGEGIAQAVASLQSMQALTTATNTILNDMRTMQAVGNAHLADIAKYNKQMFNNWDSEIKEIRKTLKDKL